MKSGEVVHELFNVDSSFTDYTKFEIDKHQRAEQKHLFINGDVYVPNYKYPELSTLYDIKINEETGEQSVLSAKKMAIHYAIMELDSLKDSGAINADLAELYASYYELRLKRILLVEAARSLLNNQSSDRQESLRRSFLDINKELYGEFNDADFYGILATESQRLKSLNRNDELTARVADDLKEYYEFIEDDIVNNQETQLLDEEIICKMFPIIKNRFSAIWECVPNTPDSIYYGAHECKKIINQVLDRANLASRGWRSIVDPFKKAPSTSSDSKKISLTSTTSRNAKQLRALIIHEVGIHAGRAQNGEDAKVNILKSGTAKYADVEEGLAVLLECVVSESVDNPALHRARDRYITTGVALGRDKMGLKDARKTYEILWRIIASRNSNENGIITHEAITKSKDEAYDHIENAFRGTNFAMPGMIYAKLKMYREGLIKNIEYFRNNIDNLEDSLDKAMIGKYNHTDYREREIVEKILSNVEKT